MLKREDHVDDDTQNQVMHTTTSLQGLERNVGYLMAIATNYIHLSIVFEIDLY